ncbi:MAG TPA: A/G-specific adenine glycosylase [Acidobacteriaceae bacterium]|nr:A/G-specific adenine glycosylase [Acidobacteriaceae bacterium]
MRLFIESRELRAPEARYGELCSLWYIQSVVTHPATIRKFQQDLSAWFDSHARDLPWRRTSDPYCIWVSEIMLQQTRVSAVIDYYTRFLTLFPTVAALAQAAEPDVLAAWSGLGYYRRAKHMHKAAQVVVRDHQGIFPRSAEELRKLPGIGDYTSAAIASIAFGEPAAVVDGNVERVVLRLFPGNEESSSPKWFRERATELLDPESPGRFNQAMMELGATVCLPQRPLCLHCPVQTHCLTRGEHQAPPPKKMRKRQVAYALLCRKRTGTNQVLLEQRSSSASLMPGMWELPEVAMFKDDDDRVEITVRHAITVTNYEVRVLRFSEREIECRLPAGANPRQWMKSSELSSLPLTGLARKVLRRLQIMPHEVR